MKTNSINSNTSFGMAFKMSSGARDALKECVENGSIKAKRAIKNVAYLNKRYGNDNFIDVIVSNAGGYDGEGMLSLRMIDRSGEEIFKNTKPKNIFKHARTTTQGLLNQLNRVKSQKAAREARITANNYSKKVQKTIKGIGTEIAKTSIDELV